MNSEYSSCYDGREVQDLPRVYGYSVECCAGEVEGRDQTDIARDFLKSENPP